MRLHERSFNYRQTKHTITTLISCNIIERRKRKGLQTCNLDYLIKEVKCQTYLSSQIFKPSAECLYIAFNNFASLFVEMQPWLEHFESKSNTKPM